MASLQRRLTTSAESSLCRQFLNAVTVSDDQMSTARLFHASGPATANARLPNLTRILGTRRSTQVTTGRHMSDPVGRCRAMVWRGLDKQNQTPNNWLTMWQRSDMATCWPAKWLWLQRHVYWTCPRWCHAPSLVDSASARPDSSAAVRHRKTLPCNCHRPSHCRLSSRQEGHTQMLRAASAEFHDHDVMSASHAHMTTETIPEIKFTDKSTICDIL